MTNFHLLYNAVCRVRNRINLFHSFYGIPLNQASETRFKLQQTILQKVILRQKVKWQPGCLETLHCFSFL